MINFIVSLLAKIFNIKNGCVIFIDRTTAADDNAEHLYRYVRKSINSERQLYFILNRDSPDWDRLRRDNFDLLDPRSIKAYVAIANCGLWICSDLEKVCQFNPKKNHRVPLVFLQHGVSMFKDVGDYVRKLLRLDMVVCTSEQEALFYEKTLLIPKNILKITGFPRHDLLYSRCVEDTCILVMPTWSSEVVWTIRHRGIKKARLLDWFKFWNGLILRLQKNKRLKIIVAPHPRMRVLFDVEEFENVQIKEKTESYQECIRKCKVLITDYSSISWDFAYINKCTIFYNPGYFSKFALNQIEKRGCGPVARTEEEVIREIDKILSGEKMFEERLRLAFSYRDRKNSERTWTEICKIIADE